MATLSQLASRNNYSRPAYDRYSDDDVRVLDPLDILQRAYIGATSLEGMIIIQHALTYLRKTRTSFTVGD